MDATKEIKAFKFNRSYVVGIISFSIGLGLFLTLFFATRSAMDTPTGGNLYIGVSILFTFLVSISISFGAYPFFRLVVKNFGWQTAPFLRAALMLLVSIVIPALIISFWVFVFDFSFGRVTVDCDRMDSVLYFDHIVTAIIITVFMVFIYELRSLYAVWRDSLIEKEKLKRESIEYQYNALTTQLDPHFLFNALNVLSSLVRAKDDKAIDFIDNFSDLYRYVLNAQKEVAVPLKNELALVDKYLSLQLIRYQNNLNFSLELKHEDNKKLVPPLSVQLLVENAIKHNIISHAKPLTIEIITKDDMLYVKSTFQPRTVSDSNKVGHKILEQRYAHITDKLPNFEIKDNQYIATIPLLDDDE